jgi:hypothetical protein
MAVWIKTDGTQQDVVPERGRYFTLEELQQYVGGWIEMIGLSDGRTIVCNEEGKIHGLPLNTLATDIWLQHFGPPDVLVGNVLVAEDHELEA